MSYSIRRREIINRVILFRLSYLSINNPVSSVGKEYRPRLRTACIYMCNSVNFLLSSCILMLLNYIITVIINRSTCYNACLASSIHCKFVYIIRSVRILNICTVCHSFIQHLPGLLVYFRRIHINRTVELCLRSVYAKK